MKPERVFFLRPGSPSQPVQHVLGESMKISQLTIVIGPNGSGKSSLLRTINDLLAPRESAYSGDRKRPQDLPLIIDKDAPRLGESSIMFFSLDDTDAGYMGWQGNAAALISEFIIEACLDQSRTIGSANFLEAAFKEGDSSLRSIPRDSCFTKEHWETLIGYLSQDAVAELLHRSKENMVFGNVGPRYLSRIAQWARKDKQAHQFLSELRSQLAVGNVLIGLDQEGRAILYAKLPTDCTDLLPQAISDLKHKGRFKGIRLFDYSSNMIEDAVPGSRQGWHYFQWDEFVLVPLSQISNVSKDISALLISEEEDSLLKNIETALENVAWEIADFVGEGDPEPFKWLVKQDGSTWTGDDFDAILKSFDETEIYVDDTDRQNLRLMWDERGDTGSYVLNRYIVTAMHCLNNLVNEYLPDFISEEFHFKIDITNPNSWSDGPKVSCYLRRKSMQAEASQNPIELKYAGSGIRRWVATVLSLILNGTAAIKFDLTDQQDTELVDIFPDDALLRLLIQVLKKSPVVSIDRGNQLILIDEPEANLHPAARASIVRWLQNVSIRFGYAIIATHDLQILDTPMLDSPEFNLDQRSAHRYVFEKYHNESHGLRNFHLEEIPGDPSTWLQLKKAMGYSLGDLFLQTKLWLLVEGLADVVVLQEFCGQLLEERGVRLVPLHGYGNARNTASSEVLAGLARKIVILRDSPAPGGRDSGDEDLLEQIRSDIEKINSDVKVEVAKIPFYDIIWYLDTPKQVHPIKSWVELWNNLEASGRQKTVKEFKRFLENTYKFSYNVRWVANTAKKMQKEGRIPIDLVEIVDAITRKV